LERILTKCWPLFWLTRLAAIAIPVPLVFGAIDLFSGTWKLDPAKSKLRPPAIQSETIRIETENEDITLIREGTDSKGDPFQLKLHAQFGGNVFGLMNSSAFASVRLWRTDSRTIMVEFMKSGATVESATIKASKDGKVLKWTTTIRDAKGKEAKYTAVFDKH
jgi:hypothetical protein